MTTRNIPDDGFRLHVAGGDGKEDQWIAFNTVIWEAVHLFHVMRFILENIHGDGELSSAKRSVLLEIQQTGPLTVPQLARTRRVSRQSIQKVVNLLCREGRVVFVDNPHHKRSKQVALTEVGGEYLQLMMQKEYDSFRRMNLELTPKDLYHAGHVMAQVRGSIDEWMSISDMRLDN